MLKSELQDELSVARAEIAKLQVSKTLVSRACVLSGAARAVISDGLNHRSRDALVRAIELFDRSYGETPP
jgi:hypothetical protein